MADPHHVSSPPPAFDADGDATRRTWLAAERTWLAWVRTGLTALAVAVGIGKIAPAVAGDETTWPWIVLGVAYAAYGTVLVVYGYLRHEEVEEAIHEGRYVPPSSVAGLAFVVAGTVLGLATMLVLALS
jgi:putative membrane protein